MNPSDRGSIHVGAEYDEFKDMTIAIDRLSSRLKAPSSSPAQASEAILAHVAEAGEEFEQKRLDQSEYKPSRDDESEPCAHIEIKVAAQAEAEAEAPRHAILVGAPLSSSRGRATDARLVLDEIARASRFSAGWGHRKRGGRGRWRGRREPHVRGRAGGGSGVSEGVAAAYAPPAVRAVDLDGVGPRRSARAHDFGKVAARDAAQEPTTLCLADLVCHSSLGPEGLHGPPGF